MRRFLACLAPAFLLPIVSAEQVAPAPSPVESPAADYVRFLDTPNGPDLLQTAIVRFAKGQDFVDLVAVVHVGDTEYYEGLDDYLKNFDAVLYEMVGGKYEAPEGGEEAPPADDTMAGIRQLQQMAKGFLGLEFQLDGIDYSAPNFVHADVDWESYQQLMEAKNQSFATLFSRAMALSDEGEIPGIPSDEEALGLMLGSIVGAIATGDTNGLKRSIAPMLSEAEGFIALLEGEDGTVLVTERNKVVMEKLAEVRAQRPAGNYAIFYGAGHMPDLEARLLADGFEKVDTGWSDAWKIGDSPASAGAGNATALGDYLLKMLQTNPEVMEAIGQLEGALEELQKPVE